jgi:hypothetical protein
LGPNMADYGRNDLEVSMDLSFAFRNKG